MSLTVRAAIADDRVRWEGFLATIAEADVLQSWAWGEAWRPEGETPIRLLVEESADIRGAALMLVRPTSAGRSIVYVPHGPVWPRAAADGDKIFAALLEALAETAREHRAVVLKLDPRASLGGPDAYAIDELARGHGLRRARHDLQARTTRIVALRDGGPELAASWDKAERNRVRRAAREDVTTTVDRDADPAALEAFTGLLAETGERAGFHPRSGGFLERLASELARSGGWYLTLARLGDRPIAGAITPRIGDRAFYLYGASARDTALRHAFGSDAAMAAAMAILAADGVRSLDMWGVAELGDESADPTWAGFSLFKRRFGGVPIRHPGTFDLVVDRPLYLLRDARERVADAIGRSR
jgi:lipid II:glycine glycyltransferase (peptidoglycan interpeptide bridge formation enzyme)